MAVPLKICSQCFIEWSLALSFLPLECRHSLVLVQVEEPQVGEWFLEKRLFLSKDLGAGRR